MCVRRFKAVIVIVSVCHNNNYVCVCLQRAITVLGVHVLSDNHVGVRTDHIRLLSRHYGPDDRTILLDNVRMSTDDIPAWHYEGIL